MVLKSGAVMNPGSIENVLPEYLSQPRIFCAIPRMQYRIPNPIDLAKYPFVGIPDKTESSAITIVHAPNDRRVKGTQFVIDAINRLTKEGYNIDFQLIENIPNTLAIQHYMKADIIIDQLLIGWYGMLSIEAMALGKPVCVYINQTCLPYLPDDTVHNCNANNLIDQLRLLIENRELRKKLSINGRNFVEQYHESSVVARKITSYYF